MPQALIAFLESSDYEDAVRKAISLGGDADTLACISGAVAEAHYGGVPPHIAEQTLALLDDRLRRVVVDFRERYSRGDSAQRGRQVRLRVFAAWAGASWPSPLPCATRCGADPAAHHGR